jgi:hypothetical protein
VPAPNLGPQYDLAARLSALEDQMRRMQANPIGQAFSATQSDGSVGIQIVQDPTTGALDLVVYQGPSSPRDPNTGLHPIMAYLGQLVSQGVPVDSGAIFQRPTGVPSAVFGNRGLQVYDTVGHQVFATDEYTTSASGIGLNNPWIPLGQMVSASPNNAGWPNTTSTSMAEVGLLAFPAQHTQISWYGITYLASGAGSVQLALNNGASGTVHNVGAGFSYLNDTMPVGTWTWHEVLQLTANAQVTSGAGPIYFAVLGVWGCGSGF